MYFKTKGGSFNLSALSVISEGIESSDHLLIAVDGVLYKVAISSLSSFFSTDIQNKLDGDGAPTANDDSSEGYEVGSLWIDITSDPKEAYRCVDATEGAAVWLNTTLEIADLGDIVTHDADEFALVGHNHDEDYSAIGHNHDEDYADILHNHDSYYALKVVLDEYEAPTGCLVVLKEDGELEQSDSKPADFATADHNHDEDYADILHNHDDDYANKVVPDEYGSDGYLVELDENGDLVQSDKQTSELATKKITEIDGSSALTLTVAQCSGTIINNYGQGAEDVEHQLPNAIEGLSFISVCGTTQAGNTWGFKAGTNDKVYLDGEAGEDNGVVEVTPAIGNFATWFTYKTGEGVYDWMCQSGQGTWGVPA